MALFHFTVTQTKRSKGQSAIASAAYRSGEKLYSEYYGEYSDYTRKRGVICSDILLPPHAPKEYADRQTLWNAVEKAERGKNAQLAYSFEISLQNEFSLEENIALAREFLFREFVSRGMTVDVSFHEKECEDGGTPNPHFHFLCPIRPMEQDGTWGIKQRREYVLDEEGNRIRDANGKYVFNAVPTTDWGSPETLEHWREAWAEMCNAKFAEKGLDVRIDHRSYERQGVDLLPTIHEGATVRAMEKKGIRTEKGEFNRWIKATNAVIKDIRKKISLLFDWITEIKAELAKPQTPDLVSLLNDYYTQRKAGAYSQKGKISNLKEMNETYNYKVVAVVRVWDIAVWIFPVDTLAFLRLCLFNCTDFLACIAGVKLVKPVPQGGKLVILPRCVNSVVNRDIAHSVFGKYNLYEFARFQIVSAKTGEVFGNNRRHSSGFHFLQHRLQPLALKTHAGKSVVHKKLCVQKMVFVRIALKYHFLVLYASAFSGLHILLT